VCVGKGGFHTKRIQWLLKQREEGGSVCVCGEGGEGGGRLSAKPASLIGWGRSWTQKCMFKAWM